MEAFGFLFFTLLLLLLRGSVCNADTTELIGAMGRSVTFRIQSPDGDAAAWIFGNDAIVTVLFEDPPRALFFGDKYKRRFSVSENGRALSISQLSMEDAGTYSVKINEKTSTFTLRVYRELAEPVVTCEAQNCSAGSCRFSLRCSVPGTGLGNVSYVWTGGNLPRDEGPTVRVENSSQEEVKRLTCTARNPVSSRNVTVTVPGGLCADNSTHPPSTDAPSGKKIGIGAAAGIAVAVLLSVFLVFLCKSKGWRKFHLSKDSDTDPISDYTTVYAQVGPAQESVPNGRIDKPKETPGAESSNTIYSLVKRPGRADDGTTDSASVRGLELV